MDAERIDGRDLATVLMLKALFGAVERLDPTLSADGFRQKLEEQIDGLIRDRADPAIARVRLEALDRLSDVLP